MTTRRWSRFYWLIGTIGTSVGLAVHGYPGCEDYARWTTRRIPVVVLEPARQEGSA